MAAVLRPPPPPSAPAMPASSPTSPAAPAAAGLAAPVPAWLADLRHRLPPLLPSAELAAAAAAAAAADAPPTRSALHLLRVAHAAGGEPHAVVLRSTAADGVVDSLVALLNPPAAVPADRAAALVAVHALCTEKEFRERFVAHQGVEAVCAVVAPPPDSFAPNPPGATGPAAEREGARLGGGSSRRLVVSVREDDAAGGGRLVWNAAIRTIAKLMVCSVAACAVSIESGALALLARAARPTQPMDIRLRAAAGLAAIAAWSGPRRAVEIVETEYAVLSMTAILTETDERIPSDLRTATIDGLVVMSYRRHARRVLQKHNTEEKIKAAARHATQSGDYAAAARGTVAAGQLTGRSIDEYGFLVEDEAQDTNNASFTGTAGTDLTDATNTASGGGAAAAAAAAGSASETAGKGGAGGKNGSGAGSAGVSRGGGNDGGNGTRGKGREDEGTPRSPGSAEKPRKQKTGLSQIKQRLLEEPYTSVEDLDVLEEIVHEEAGVLSSSPRDRNYMRRAARTYGVSADEIEFISLLEEEMAAANHDDPALRTMSAPLAMGPDAQRLSAKAFGRNAAGAVTSAEMPPIASKDDGFSVATAAALATVDDITPAIPSSATAGPRARSHAPRRSRPTSISTTAALAVNGSTALPRPERGSAKGRSSPQRSSLPPGMEDPDFDRSLRDGGSDSSANAESPSKMISPLVMFSSATKRAAEKGSKNNLLQKTTSQLSRDTECERTWREVIDNHPEMLEREQGRTSRVVAYRKLALVPVPPPLRRKLWPILLDTASLREAKPNLYATLCDDSSDEALPDDIEHTIEADVTRTMPLHSLFWAGGAQVGVQSLRSILRAYARYVPEVGYCQGMSSIAAVLIMNAEDEEEAFLMMAQFMSRFQYKKVFAPGFPLMLQWISELKPLVAHYMPELDKRFERENVSLELYADKWLITALSHNFPHRYLLRVWDLMFLGGSPKIILKACLAVLKQCESQLMTMNFEQMMPFLQRGFADPEAGVLDAKNPEPFITLMREFRFLPVALRGQARNGTHKSQATTGASRQERREGRSGSSCLPCFRRSPTVD